MSEESKALSFWDKTVVPFFKDLIKSKDAKKQEYADVIVTTGNEEILLLKRSSNSKVGTGQWCLAGGHIDEGENPTEAAQRELKEETGLNLSCEFIKTIEKENCIIHYFQAQLNDNLIMLDNDEHFGYEFVPFKELDEYNMIFDLKDVLKELHPYLHFPNYSTVEEQHPLTPEEIKPDIKKSFNEGLISDDDYLIYLQITSAIENIAKAYEQGSITGEAYCNAIEKSKHYEFVKVNRDGKQFMQYRQVGTNKIEEDIEVGDQINTGELDLFIKKYSDKSFLIGGDTYKNLALLRKIKVDAGVGTFNRTLNGWVFPLTAKASILANLADKMEVGTYDETVAKEAVIDLKNAVDTGTEVEVNGSKATVDGVSINEEGKVEYSVNVEPAGSKEELNELMDLFDWAESNLPEVKEEVAEKYDKNEINNFIQTSKFKANTSNTYKFFNINNEKQIRISKDVNTKTGVNNGYRVTLHSKISSEITYNDYEKNIKVESLQEAKVESAKLYFNELRKDVSNKFDISDKKLDYSKLSNDELKKINEGTNDFSIMAAIKAEERKRNGNDENKEKPKAIEVPIGTISPDGKSIKTADGWEYIKQKKVTETEIAIPPASDKKAEELINNATEENRTQTGKELFGKEAGAEPVSVEIEKKGMEDIKIEVKEFRTRSGEVVSALDFTGVKHDTILLADVKTILTNPKPNYIPDINEYIFGGNDKTFVFDYVRIDDNDNYLVSLNGYKRAYRQTTNKRNVDVENKFAVMSLDVLVATTEYYRTKRKAEFKIEAIKEAEDAKNDWYDSTEAYKVLTLKYYNLSDKQKQSITEREFYSLDLSKRIEYIPDMKVKPYAEPKAKRMSILSDRSITFSAFDIYKDFVDKNYFKPRSLTYADPCVTEFNKARKDIELKTNDMEIQREESDGSFAKGRETSYGNSGTKDYLLDSHGVLIKRQNGDEISEKETNQIKDNLDKVFESFGDRSEMSKNFGLKISHAGSKNMHAMKAMGVYYPAYKAIGVSDNEHGKFGFTLAHEIAHFLDHWAGSKSNRYFASDDYQSTAGKIASLFRDNMNVKTDNKYLLSSKECLARSFEQYHAMKHNGEDVIKSKLKNVPYHASPEHVNKEKFNTIIKPLIEQFLQENDHLLKSAYDELNLVDIDNNFEIIKAVFYSNIIGEDKFLEYLDKYNEITKSLDPSHGGKLTKREGRDGNGKKDTKWVKRNGDDEGKDKSTSKDDLEPVTHSKNVLSTYAKETPEKELRRVISESHDEKLRTSAQHELDRRGKEEKLQEDKKPEVKKKPKIENNLAPNGKKSNLTDEQYKTVRSKEFKNWFGDWEKEPEKASKVVDENGEPKILHHGTNSEFTEFNEKEIASNSGNSGHYGFGFYFSDDVREAKGYGKKVLSSFMNLRNPFTQKDENYDLLKENGVKSVEDKENLSIDFNSVFDQVDKKDKVAGKFLNSLKKHGYEKGWSEFLKENKASDSKLDLNDVSDLFEHTQDGSYIPDGESFNENYKDFDIDYKNLKFKEGYRHEQNLHHITDLGNNAKEVTDVMKKIGFDGVIVGSEYVAFKSNQVKLSNAKNFNSKSNNFHE